jgi:hypothetical protein
MRFSGTTAILGAPSPGHHPASASAADALGKEAEVKTFETTMLSGYVARRSSSLVAARRLAAQLLLSVPAGT